MSEDDLSHYMGATARLKAEKSQLREALKMALDELRCDRIDGSWLETVMSVEKALEFGEKSIDIKEKSD